MADKILSKIKDGNGDKFIFRDDAAVHTVDSALSTTSTNPVQNKVVKSALDGKQDTLSTQTAYTSKGSATKVPQITTNSLGQVTGITEVTITQPDISGKEDSNNKVSSWSETTNDTHYPSEKLVKDSLDAKAPLASPTFTGTPKAPTAAAGTNTTQIATTAFVKTAVDNAIAGVADALIYKGTIAGGSTGTYGALTAAANKGDLYKVSTAGKIDGVKVEVGDMLICNTDNTAAATSSNYSTVAANWDFIQANIDGYVLGPESSVDAHVATFDGTAGNTIKDSGYTIAANVPSGAVFTDTKVTSSGNHYTPATASGSDKSASASGATAEWGIDVVKGVTLNTDGKGHVTGISVTSGKIPSNPNTDTKVKATAKTDDVNYKILATASASPTSGNATEAVYDADITLNPSTNTIAANISGDAATASAAKSGSTLATTIAGKQDALTAQTAYSAKGSATKVPQITTNSLGQVTGITEVNIEKVYDVVYNSTTYAQIEAAISDGYVLRCKFNARTGAYYYGEYLGFSDGYYYFVRRINFGNSNATVYRITGDDQWTLFGELNPSITYMTTDQETAIVTELGDL